MSKLGMPFLYVFLFLAYSRVADFTVPYLHLPIITATIALIFAFFNRGLFTAFSSRIGLALIGFTGWFLVCTPFSYWKGGSVQLLTDRWAKSLMVFFMIFGLVQTFRQCRRVMYVLACSTLVITIMCFLFGRRSFGRLALPVGLLDNPNDLAQMLLLGLPFWWLIALNESAVPFRRVLASICIGLMVVAVAQTGSRSGFVSLAVLGFFIFRAVSLGGKVKLALAAVALMVLAVALVPESVTGRYVTMFGADPAKIGDAAELRTVESTSQRVRLMKESIKLTLTNPLFGVGPGQFQTYSAQEFNDRGQRAMWRETHCAYTQVSSEMGIPGLAFFAAVILFSLHQAASIYKVCRKRRDLSDLEITAYALLLSLLSLAVTAVFSSVAYTMFFPTLGGITAAFYHVARAEIASRGPAPASEMPKSPARALWPALRPRTASFV
jgi:hypothetical protein